MAYDKRSGIKRPGLKHKIGYCFSITVPTYGRPTKAKKLTSLPLSSDVVMIEITEGGVSGGALKPGKDQV